jgi:hypothetical protein
MGFQDRIRRRSDVVGNRRANRRANLWCIFFSTFWYNWFENIQFLLQFFFESMSQKSAQKILSQISWHFFLFSEQTDFEYDQLLNALKTHFLSSLKIWILFIKIECIQKIDYISFNFWLLTILKEPLSNFEGINNFWEYIQNWEKINILPRKLIFLKKQYVNYSNMWFTTGTGQKPLSRYNFLWKSDRSTMERLSFRLRWCSGFRLSTEQLFCDPYIDKTLVSVGAICDWCRCLLLVRRLKSADDLVCKEAAHALGFIASHLPSLAQAAVDSDAIEYLIYAVQ